MRAACVQARQRVDAEQQRLMSEVATAVAAARKQVSMRMGDFALARSHASFAGETAKRVIALPIYPLLSYASQALQQQTTAFEQAQRLLQQNNTVDAGVQVRGVLPISNTAALCAMQMVVRTVDIAAEVAAAGISMPVIDPVDAADLSSEFLSSAQGAGNSVRSCADGKRSTRSLVWKRYRRCLFGNKRETYFHRIRYRRRSSGGR